MVAILADNIFKCIFLNENDRIPIQISLKFVPRSPIDNKPALIQVMAWRRPGDKPLPETMMTLFTYAYRGRWVNLTWPMQDCTDVCRKKMQCDAFITLLIFSQIFTKDIP